MHYLIKAFYLATVLLASAGSQLTQNNSKLRLFDAEAYGAVANDDSDDRVALQAAIDDAVKHGENTAIVLRPGIYRIGASPEGPSALKIEDARKLELRGESGKTELIFTEPRQGGIFVTKSNEVFIRHLTIDFDPPPFMQGVVRRQDGAAGHFELLLQDGFPSLREPWFSEAPRPYGQWGVIIDTEHRRLKSGTPDFIFLDHWEQLDKNLWRIYVVEDQRDRIGYMKQGDRFVHMARSGPGAIFFNQSRHSGVENVTIHASPSLAIGAVSVDGLIVRNARIAFRKNTARLIATNADGVHCQQNLEGPLIEHCYFEGMADDAVNIYYYPNKVLEVRNNSTFHVSAGGIIEPGELIQFFEPVEGLIRGEARTVNVSHSDNGYEISLDRVLSCVHAAPDGGDHVYNLSRAGRGFAIRHNTFHYHRRHGVMIKAPGGVVESNTIEGCGGFGIVVGNDPDWPEGVIPTDIVIRGNRVAGCGRSVWYPRMSHAAAIQVTGRAEKGRLAKERIVKRITITQNEIIDPPGAGISIGSAQDVSIVGNSVHFGNEAILVGKHAAIEVINTEAVRVADLMVTGHRDELIAAIQADNESLGSNSYLNVEESSVHLPDMKTLPIILGKLQ